MTGQDQTPPPEQAVNKARRQLVRKLAYSAPAIVALSVGARQAAAQPPPPGEPWKPPAPPQFNLGSQT